MTDHTGLPVAGYLPQSDDNVRAVNANKQAEERVLRLCDAMLRTGKTGVDHRWAQIARTHFQQGFMALNRAIFQPARIGLPEDGGSDITDSAPEGVANG